MKFPKWQDIKWITGTHMLDYVPSPTYTICFDKVGINKDGSIRYECKLVEDKLSMSEEVSCELQKRLNDSFLLKLKQLQENYAVVKEVFKPIEDLPIPEFDDCGDYTSIELVWDTEELNTLMVEYSTICLTYLDKDGNQIYKKLEEGEELPKEFKKAILKKEYNKHGG